MLELKVAQIIPKVARKIVQNGPSPASFPFIFVFSNKHYIFTINILWKMCIQFTYGAGIRTHDLQNMNILP